MISRRLFLMGSSSLSALALAGGEQGYGQTLNPNQAWLAQQTATVSSAPVVAAVFNGGRSQVNPTFLSGGGDFPFLNCMKTSQGWDFIDGSGWPEPSTLDANGYPTSISHGGVRTVFYVPSQAVRPGNYVITWSGNGKIFCGMANTPISGSQTSTSGTGRYVFSTNETRFVIGISSVGSPYITNLKVFHASDEPAINAGQVFGAQFKKRLVEANFGVIRFLDWQNATTSNVTTWATRRPIDYVTYGGTEFRSSLYAGLTTNVGAAYSANLSGFSLADKAMVIVKFNASTNSPCTLNVNGTGDINILSEYAAPLNTYSYPIGGTWRSFATLIYDATLNAWIKHGGDLARASCGIDNGCPPELMVRLCAEVGAHPYFVTPYLAIDPATNYIPNLAAYCRASGPSWMIPRFEGPNELWNSASPFYATNYARAKATAYGWAADSHNWYGKVMSVLGQIVSSTYGDDRTKYQVLCGVQTMTGSSLAGLASSNARLESSKYVSQSAPAQYPYTKTPASKWVTHICCAQYFGPSEYNTPQEVTDAAAYAAATDAATQLAIATNYANTVNSGSGPYTLQKVASCYANWKVWALAHGITKMCGYEGGYSPDYTSGGTSPVDRLRAASKLAASLNTFTAINYNNFIGLTDAKFTAEFPSCFNLSGRTPSNNAWSVLEDVYQSPNPPQWNAIVSFNH